MTVLIWTRALTDWEEDAQKLSRTEQLPELNLMRVPCLKLAPVPVDSPISKDFTAAILTSANALRLAPPQLQDMLRQCQYVYTHGEKTAATARALGISSIEQIAVRTAEELAEMVIARLPHTAKVLIPTAAIPAFDLGEALRATGLDVTTITTYQTIQCVSRDDGSSLTQREVETARRQWQGVVCFASPSAVGSFVTTFLPEPNRLRDSLVAVALGPTTAAACAEAFRSVQVAPQNRIDSLIDAALAVLRADQNHAINSP